MRCALKFPTFEEWLSSLPEVKRSETLALVERFKLNGASNPERWARSEIKEDIPQLARYLLLKQIWDYEIDRWSSEPERWIDDFERYSSKRPIPVFANAAAAIKRIRALGASSEDLGALAFLIAYAAAFGTLYRVDSTSCSADQNDAPGWRLVEVGTKGELTGRVMAGLHESLLSIHEDRVRDEDSAQSKPPVG